MKKTWIIIFALLLTVILAFSFISILSSNKYFHAQSLLSAIEAENEAKVESILQAGLNPNQADVPVSRYWSIFESSARRPLTVACSTGNLRIVEILIKYGATAEYVEYTGWSPLRETVFFYDADDVQIVKLLLENGADPDVEESGEHSVFTAAKMYPMLRGSDDFLNGYDDTIAEEITQIVKMLLVNQSIDIQSPSGETVLMLAAKRGNIVLVEYCITQGCDMDLKNTKGQTAYDIAVEYGKQEAAELIQRHMVNP